MTSRRHLPHDLHYISPQTCHSCSSWTLGNPPPLPAYTTHGSVLSCSPQQHTQSKKGNTTTSGGTILNSETVAQYVSFSIQAAVKWTFLWLNSPSNNNTFLVFQSKNPQCLLAGTRNDWRFRPHLDHLAESLRTNQPYIKTTREIYVAWLLHRLVTSHPNEA